MVSAYANETGLVLGLQRCEEKSNEITAIEALLRNLALSGCIVTIDAMGCQTAIAAQVVERQGDYLLTTSRITSRSWQQQSKSISRLASSRHGSI